MEPNLVYLNYWKRKEIVQSKLPQFPLLKWWFSEELCETEKILFNAVKNRNTVLDIGAGDLRIMQKFKNNGYSGEYHTQDVGHEFNYTYQNIEDIYKQYNVVLCLDVIEHLQLTEGLALIHKLINLLAPEGVMIIQTPNGRCIRSPLSSDMTHLHCYNINDLWSYLTCMGLQVEGYRVVFEQINQTWIQRLSNLVSKYIITRFLGLDYADNIVLIAHKSNIN